MAERRQKRKRGYKCRECFEEFAQNEVLWRHIKATHGPVEYLCCKQCQYRATARSTMERHYVKFHPAEREEAKEIKPTREDSAPEGPNVLLAQVDASGGCPNEDGTVEAPRRDASAEEETVILSLSPCPISPLMRCPSPHVTIPSGKPRGMMSMMAPRPPSPASSRSSMPSLEPRALSPEREHLCSPPPVRCGV